MDMLTSHQQQVIHEGVRGLVRPITISYYTPDVPSAATAAERALLEAIAGSSEQIRLDVLADRWDATREERVGIARTPAIVLRGDDDPGIRYYGTPDGYELEVFLGIIRALSDRRSGLSDHSRQWVRELTHPLHLEVLVAPT